MYTTSDASVLFDSLDGGRRVRLEAHIGVPCHSDDLHKHHLIVQWNEIEVDELNCRPKI